MDDWDRPWPEEPSPEDDRGGFYVKEFGVCFECGGETRRVDICFEGFLHYTCGPEADRKFWEAEARVAAGVLGGNYPYNDDEDW